MQIMALDVATIKSASAESGHGCACWLCGELYVFYRAATVRVQVLEGLPQPVGRQIHLQKTKAEQNRTEQTAFSFGVCENRRQSICFAKTGLGEGWGAQAAKLEIFL